VGLVTTLLNSCGYKLKQKQKQKESNISNEYRLRMILLLKQVRCQGVLSNKSAA